MKNRIHEILRNQIYRRNILCFLVLPVVLNLAVEMMRRTASSCFLP